ncbi:DinB/UmuC family translesion DNA polymerase [Actinacidiphila glaucinigra]
MVATALPQSISLQRGLDADTLGPDLISREILHAVVDVAHQLRERGQVARVLTLGIAFAGGSSVSRSRTLREPSAYTDDLRLAAAELFERMGLQRARVRGVSVRAEQLSGAEGASVQLSLDLEREAGHRLDPVVDQVIARFGPGAVTWAPLAHRRRSA